MLQTICNYLPSILIHDKVAIHSELFCWCLNCYGGEKKKEFNLFHIVCYS